MRIPIPVQTQTEPLSSNSSSRLGPVTCVQSLGPGMADPPEGWETWMVPHLSLAAELHLRAAPAAARRAMATDPERMTDLMCQLMEANALQGNMLCGALGRVVELRAQLALAEMNADSLKNRCESLQELLDEMVESLAWYHRGGYAPNSLIDPITGLSSVDPITGCDYMDSESAHHSVVTVQSSRGMWW